MKPMEPTKFDMVFEGGGAKGMAFVGAYRALTDGGHKAGRLLGTSAGAIAATLIAAGYTPKEMHEALNEKDDSGKSVFNGFMGAPAKFTDTEIEQCSLQRLFNEINIPLVPEGLEKMLDTAIFKWLANNDLGCHFFAFVERGGWYGADAFVSWLEEKLDKDCNDRNEKPVSKMTLKEFSKAKKNKAKVELSVVASDTTEGRILILNHRTAPNCPLVWAVRISMSIPFLWEEVVWNEEWGKYNINDINGHVIVDGGVLSNFPIELFISDNDEVTNLMGTSNGSVPVLGLLLDESKEVESSTNTTTGGAKPVETSKNDADGICAKLGTLKTVKRCRRLIDTMTGAHDKMVMEGCEDLIVRIPAKGYGTTEFDMSDERRDELVNAAERAMKAYLNPPLKLAGGKEAGESDRIKNRADRIAKRLLGL